MAEKICSEMSANVWKVVAAVGETIAEGEPVIIMESMKMEIPVLAEEGGTVTALHVAEGDVVEVGQVLAVLE